MDDPAVCDSCMATSCCPQNDTCAANPDCVALITCAAYCEMDSGASSCGVTCEQKYAAGWGVYESLMQCMSTSCDLEACFPLF